MNNKHLLFIQKYKVEENKERILLLKLQKAYENGQILEEEMSDKIIFMLEKLYQKQIDILQNKYINYKKKITSIKKSKR